MLVQRALLHMASCVAMIEGHLVTYRFSCCAPRMAFFQIKEKKKKINRDLPLCGIQCMLCVFPVRPTS
jgi:hypothetical protein